MRNKIIAIVAIMAIAVSMTGCKKKQNEQSNVVNNEPNQTVATEKGTIAGGVDPSASTSSKTAEQIQEEMDNFAKDADKNVDMSKIAGTVINGEGDNFKGDIGGYDIEILDAVLTDGENSKVLVVEFDFKNLSSVPVTFASVIVADAFQGANELPRAATFNAEGYDILTTAQEVASGDSIKVQRAYVVTDTTQPVTVEVAKNQTVGGSIALSKTFNLQ